VGYLDDLIETYKNNDFTKSVELANTLVEFENEDNIIWNILGSSNLILGNNNEAIRAFKRVCELSPKDVQAFYNLAICYHKSGNTRKAEETCQACIELNPGFIDPYIKLGDLLLERNEAMKAISVLRSAIELDPTSFAGLFKLGYENIKSH
jgi:tetratricopeptide (TPR) repeat protein